MADSSEMLTYVLYIVLIAVMGAAGWYIAKQWGGDGKQMMGAGIGVLVGVGAAFALHMYNSPSNIIY
jgi:uncharacterized protein YqgC (DUF456 family)